MKQITTPLGTFGPFAFVNEMDGCYDCGDTILPFVVVGQGNVEDYVPPPPPPPTQADFDAALTRHLDSVAKSRRYDNRTTCALRAGYPGPFQAEGLAFGQWMDTCNAFAYMLLSEVQAGNVPPPATIQEFIDQLPEMVWPS